MMQRAQRGNSSPLRWALVVGIVIVVVVATIIAVSGAFNKSNSSSHNGKNTAGCLHPATVHARTTVLSAPAVSIHFNRAKARKRLKTIEALFVRHRSLRAVAPNGRHFVASRSGKLVLGTVGKKAVDALTVPAQDIAFTSNSQGLIYEVSPPSKYACANEVLMTMGLSEKHQRLLLATKYSLLNAASPPAMGTLMQDELPSGWIVFVDSAGKLYAFDPKRHLVGPLQTGTLGALYTGTGINRVAVIQVSVSPNGKYFAETSQSTSGFAINSLPGDVRVRSVTRGTFPVSWSHSGYRIAFITHKRNAALTSDVISTLDLRSGKTHTVKPKNKKLGALTLSNVNWSADDLLVGFTGAKSTCAGAGSCKLRAFIGTWKGKRVHQVAASPVHKKQKKKKKTPVLR